MPPLWLRTLLYIAALVAVALFGAYHHGLSVTDAERQSIWNDRNRLDAKALAASDKEQAYQHSINKAIQDGQRTIDRATADAVIARATADSLCGAVDNLVVRLAASKAVVRAAMVVADVFKRADHAGVRGVIWEQAYDGLGRWRSRSVGSGDNP